MSFIPITNTLTSEQSNMAAPVYPEGNMGMAPLERTGSHLHKDPAYPEDEDAPAIPPRGSRDKPPSITMPGPPYEQHNISTSEHRPLDNEKLVADPVTHGSTGSETTEKTAYDPASGIHQEMDKSSANVDDSPAVRRLIRKLDLHILPPLMLLYTLSFLDRVNIGNARLYGLEQDLKIGTTQFELIVSILFVTYIVSELPSNLIIKHYVTPSKWIAFIATAWGTIATLTGITQNFGGMMATRVMLGLVEGGLTPALTVYLTWFYSKRELGLRIGYLLVSAAIAGAFGGLLAAGIGLMEGVGGLSAWRWIFILEGIPTVLIGISCWWWLADEPDTAYYLTPAEKQLVADRKAAQLGVNDEFAWKDARRAFTDPSAYFYYIAQFCTAVSLYGFSIFLPTIIKGIMAKASIATVQLLTIPCYALGAIVYMCVARFSDYKQMRAFPIIICAIISVAGYGMLISDASSSVSYAGCFLVAFGLYVSVGIPLAWSSTNNPRYGKRTVVTGLQLSASNCSGVLASFLYPESDGPRFLQGHAVTMSLLGFGALLYGVLWFYFTWKNNQREAGHDVEKTSQMSEDDIVAMGDDNPHFRFTK